MRELGSHNHHTSLFSCTQCSIHKALPHSTLRLVGGTDKYAGTKNSPMHNLLQVGILTECVSVHSHQKHVWRYISQGSMLSKNCDWQVRYKFAGCCYINFQNSTRSYSTPILSVALQCNRDSNAIIQLWDELSLQIFWDFRISYFMPCSIPSCTSRDVLSNLLDVGNSKCAVFARLPHLYCLG